MEIDWTGWAVNRNYPSIFKTIYKIWDKGKVKDNE